jgi:hypothetical protein
MKIKKYYSLDECTQQEELFSILNEYQDKEKIDYEVIEDGVYGDVIKIEDLNLTAKDHKKLIEKFDSLDLIDFPDYGYEEEDDDEEDWEEDDFNDEYEDDEYC